MTSCQRTAVADPKPLPESQAPILQWQSSPKQALTGKGGTLRPELYHADKGKLARPDTEHSGFANASQTQEGQAFHRG